MSRLFLIFLEEKSSTNISVLARQLVVTAPYGQGGGRTHAWNKPPNDLANRPLDLLSTYPE